MSLSYQDLPSVKSRNKNQLDKLYQFVFEDDIDDKEAIKQHFQGILAKKKPENVKDALRQMYYNYKEICIRSDTSVLYRHWQESHSDEGQPEFRVEVLGTHRSATERQISEALEIQRG